VASLPIIGSIGANASRFDIATVEQVPVLACFPPASRSKASDRVDPFRTPVVLVWPRRNGADEGSTYLCRTWGLEIRIRHSDRETTIVQRSPG
jgi:hypothetical protein